MFAIYSTVLRGKSGFSQLTTNLSLVKLFFPVALLLTFHSVMKVGFYLMNFSNSDF